MGGLYDRCMNTNPEKSGYEIRVRGHLDPHWASWFEGWTVANVENGEALLRNTNIDQPALHSTLTRIRDLNLALLSVVQLPMRPDQS
jgi:hypothetical protein